MYLKIFTSYYQLCKIRIAFFSGLSAVAGYVLVAAHLQVQLGGVNAAIDHYNGQITPNLLIVETKLSGADALNDFTLTHRHSPNNRFEYLNRRSTADNLGNLLGDRGLASLVELQGEAGDHVVGVRRRALHRSRLSRAGL